MSPQVAEAAKSIKKVADDLDSRMKESPPTSPASPVPDCASTRPWRWRRKTLEELNHAVRSIESNPQQFLFGKSPKFQQYSGARNCFA